ncbi:MAG: polysaccharide deacetylase, partial [Betaproteobacteria bacterium]|nr:polysaccharide deacetylase [Betaproteobacteria bacterium]
MSKTRLAQAIVPLRALLKSEITILAYHRILNSWDEEHFPFDVELISASCEDFAWQMEYVRSHYSPIAFRDVIAFLDGKCALPPRPLLVTFDDGFDDNYHH